MYSALNQTPTKSEIINNQIFLEHKDIFCHNSISNKADFLRENEEYIFLKHDDITFYDVSHNLVKIRLTLRNKGYKSSIPTSVILQAAPLGAFVDWNTLMTMQVPTINPNESIDLKTEVLRPRPIPLGNFTKVSPQKILNATFPPKGASQPFRSPTNFLQRFLVRQSNINNPRGTNSALLPPDLLDLLNRRNVYWAGNLNVFTGFKSVERHHAKSLRIYPGLTNLAMFFVNDIKQDAYLFEINGNGATWETSLFDVTFRKSVIINPKLDLPIRLSEWLEMDTRHLMILAICPPIYCQKMDLAVYVTQRSTRRTAMVEFSFDPNAQGRGCYTI